MNLHYILDLDSPMAISEMLIISLITDKQINFSGNLIILKTINIEKIKQRILTKIHLLIRFHIYSINILLKIRNSYF